MVLIDDWCKLFKLLETIFEELVDLRFAFSLSKKCFYLCPATVFSVQSAFISSDVTLNKILLFIRVDLYRYVSLFHFQLWFFTLISCLNNLSFRQFPIFITYRLVSIAYELLWIIDYLSFFQLFKHLILSYFLKVNIISMKSFWYVLF